MNERQLIEACKQGLAKAQKLFFEQYADGMFIVCLRYIKNKADAEELMLNGFYKFYTQIDKFIYSGPESIRPWLKKIMVNECLMFLRKKGQLILMDESYAEQVTVEEDISNGLNAAELMTTIMELPAGYRTVFNLFVIEDMSHKEIAAILGISEGTSKSQLNKARTLLQKMIRQREESYERNK